MVSEGTELVVQQAAGHPLAVDQPGGRWLHSVGQLLHEHHKQPG